MVSLFPYIIFWAAVIAITTGWGYPNFLRICPGCGCTFILVLLIYTLKLWHRSAFACVFEYTVFPRISVHALISALSRISAHPKAIYQISAPSPISVSLPFPSLNPRTCKWGGGDSTPQGIFLSFLLENKTSAPDVSSSCSFIPRTHFETSSVMVSCYGYEIWRHK